MDERQINGGNSNLFRHGLPLVWLIFRGIRNMFFPPNFGLCFSFSQKHLNPVFKVIFRYFAGSSTIATNLGTDEKSQILL